MSWRTRILGLVAVLVGLVLAGALALRWALAPERLEAAVEQAFAEATGLPLELAEPPALRLLPRFGLDLGPGQVAGGPEAGAEPLLAWRSVRIDASAASALRGRPELGRVEADGLHLRLRRDAAGRGNWEPALARLRQGAAAGGAGDAGSLRIAGLELTNARIDYRDARDPAAALALTGLALRAGAWSPGGTVAVEGSFVVERTARRLAVLSRAALRVGDAGDAGWRVDSLVLRGRALLPARELPFELDVPRLDVDPRGARATAAAATLGAGPARVTASALSVEWPERAPLRASGRVSLAPVAPRELLAALGLAEPRTRDPAVLARAAAEAGFAWDGAVLRLDPLSLSLDDTTLSGRLAWGSVLEFALRGDALDVDRYREPPDPGAEPFVFPGEAFAAWQARGTLELERARVEGVELEGVTLRLLLDPGAGAAQ
jgi:AsmA protein